MISLNILKPDERRNDLDWSNLVTSHSDNDDVIAAETRQYKTVDQIKKEKQELRKLKISALTTEPDEN